MRLLDMYISKINNKMATNPMIKIQGVKPSLNRANSKKRNGIAVPVSFWSSIKAVGIRMMIDADNTCFHLVKSQACCETYLANNKHVAYLANSAGCIPNPPIPIHDFAPERSTPKKKTSNINTLKIR